MMWDLSRHRAAVYPYTQTDREEHLLVALSYLNRMGYVMVSYHGICLGTVPRCTVHKQTGTFTCTLSYLDKNGLYDGVCPTMEFVSAPCRGVPYTQTDERNIYLYSVLPRQEWTRMGYMMVYVLPWNLSRHRDAVYRTHKQTRGTFTCTLSYLDKNGLCDGVCPAADLSRHRAAVYRTHKQTRGTFTCTVYLDKNGLYDGVCPPWNLSRHHAAVYRTQTDEREHLRVLCPT
ncbi:hypothetical protein J6590_089920 [Homalodisca vitripennis]|nr:hypothetical protein J6590_089920 [Homalodisca vitripennis]